MNFNFKPERIAAIRAGLLLVAANAITAMVGLEVVDWSAEQATQVSSLVSSLVILGFLLFPQSPIAPK